MIRRIVKVLVRNSLVHIVFMLPRPCPSMIVGRVTYQAGFIVSAMLALAMVAQASTFTLNFDTPPLGPGVELDATSYLNSFGITLSNVTPGSFVWLIGEGGGLPIATSPPNYFNQFNGNNPETMTLNFPIPLSSITFYRTGLTFDSKPQWSAEALNAHGMVLDAVGEPLTSTFAPIPPKLFVLTGANITALQIDSNNGGFTNLSGVPIDDMTLVTQAATTPEPQTLCLLSSGLFVLLARKRSAQNRFRAAVCDNRRYRRRDTICWMPGSTEGCAGHFLASHGYVVGPRRDSENHLDLILLNVGSADPCTRNENRLSLIAQSVGEAQPPGARLLVEKRGATGSLHPPDARTRSGYR